MANIKAQSSKPKTEGRRQKAERRKKNKYTRPNDLITQ
jgi:hypothetical protein